MARRKKNDGWFEIFLWVFTKYSAWLCIPLALFAFALINVVLIIVAVSNPLTKGLAQLGPIFGGLAAFMLLMAGLIAGLRKANRKIIYDKQTSIESIRELSWSQFELLIGEAYRRQGYDVTETGGGGADGGIDLKLKSHMETVIVQCKQWKVYKVGVKPIREFYGILMAERVDRAVFVTSGVYTQEARDFAAGKPLELIDGQGLSRLITSIPRASSSGSHHVEADHIEATEETAVCPTCQSRMVLRTAKKGENAGAQFWGCSKYPKCRGTRKLALV